MVFGVFSPGRTHCIAPKKIPDKAMSIWNLHKKFQLSSAMGLRDFDLQSQPTLMGGEPINCRALVDRVGASLGLYSSYRGERGVHPLTVPAT